VEPPEGDTVALCSPLNTYTDIRPKTILLFALIFAEPISFFHYFQQSPAGAGGQQSHGQQKKFRGIPARENSLSAGTLLAGIDR
jgi:hypothetical protein